MSEKENADKSGGEEHYRPKWLVAAPFLDPVPRLTRHQWRIIGLLGVACIFDQYDLHLFSLALVQIQADLGIPEDQIGDLGAIVRLGALPAFFFGLIADRLGRRRVLLVTIVLYTILTGATAFAQDTMTFVVLQFFARMFAVAELMLAYVVVTEELDPADRGWGVGALTALAACGSGLAIVLFGFVEILPFGWRALYLVGLIPLACVAWMRRTLPETQRFVDHQSEQEEKKTSWIRPVIDLARMYPGRILVVAVVIFLLNFTENAAGFFGPKYLQEAHGWLPWQYSVMGFFGGAIGIVGGPYAGRLSDQYGRKKVVAAFLFAHPLLVIAFYQVSGWILAPLWVAMIFAGMAGGVVLSAVGNELFPTSYRTTASGARMIVGTIGGALGLITESILYGIFDSHWNAVSIMVIGALFAPFIVLYFFPETSGRELEEISPEKTA